MKDGADSKPAIRPGSSKQRPYGEVSSFGTAPDEQSRGRDEVLALTMEQVREMNEAAGLDVAAPEEGEEDVVEAYQAGDVGWIVTHGRFTFEDGLPDRQSSRERRCP